MYIESVAPRLQLIRKVVDDTDQIRCASGSIGVLREEVYQDGTGTVVKYNLAFIHPGLYQRDHGRVLGYDNAHGFHERHFMGKAEPATYTSYEQILNRFLEEVGVLRRKA